MNEPSHKVTTDELWARAAEHMATNSIDLHIFVDKPRGLLPRPARDILVGIHKHLVADVWPRIVDLDRMGTMIDPSTAERMLILQLQKAIENDDALTLLGGATTESHCIRQVNDAAAFVKPEDIEKGDHCLFCTFDFGSTTGWVQGASSQIEAVWSCLWGDLSRHLARGAEVLPYVQSRVEAILLPTWG